MSSSPWDTRDIGVEVRSDAISLIVNNGLETCTLLWCNLREYPDRKMWELLLNCGVFRLERDPTVVFHHYSNFQSQRKKLRDGDTLLFILWDDSESDEEASRAESAEEASRAAQQLLDDGTWESLD